MDLRIEPTKISGVRRRTPRLAASARLTGRGRGSEKRRWIGSGPPRRTSPARALVVAHTRSRVMSSALASARLSALVAPASTRALGCEATRRVRARSRARVSAPANRRRDGRFVPRASSDDAEDLTTGLAHAEYLRSVAAITPPAELGALVAVLQAQGGEVVAPSARDGLHPLCIPLATREEDTVCLKVSQEDGVTLEVVAVSERVHLSLLARTCAEYVHKAMVQEEAALLEAEADEADDAARPVASAAGAVGASLYESGAFATLGKDLPVYLTLRVGKFPDAMEALTQKHLDKHDEMSAFVTCDLYKSTFGAWGRPHWYLSNVYDDLGRAEEARDCARFALTDCEWSTLGNSDDLDACLRRSGWGDKSVDEIKAIIDTRRGPNRESFDGPRTDAQIAEELALCILDKLAFRELTVKESIQRLAECYSTAEKASLAKLVMSAYSL